MTAFDAPLSLARARKIRRMQNRAARARDRRLARRLSRADQGLILAIDPERLRHTGPNPMNDPR